MATASIVSIRMKPNEKKALEDKAKRVGVNLSTYVRLILQRDDLEIIRKDNK